MINKIGRVLQNFHKITLLQRVIEEIVGNAIFSSLFILTFSLTAGSSETQISKWKVYWTPKNYVFLEPRLLPSCIQHMLLESLHKHIHMIQKNVRKHTDKFIAIALKHHIVILFSNRDYSQKQVFISVKCSKLSLKLGKWWNLKKGLLIIASWKREGFFYSYKTMYFSYSFKRFWFICT